MMKSEKKEMAAYQKGPFEDLTIQDALTLIAVCTAQMDYEDCETDVKRIEAVAESRPEFVEKRKDISSRINRYVNSLPAMDRQKAVEIAADVLKNPELKKAAFEFATEVVLPEKVLTDEKQAILDSIATHLSLDRHFAQQIIEKFTG
jgi:hypothetical protein